MSKSALNSSGSTALIDRLLHLLPSAEKLDWSQTMAARWAQGAGPALFRVAGLKAMGEASDAQLDDLLHIDTQKAQLEQNTQQFLAGLPANNVLLWGSRGTGKSTLVQALLNKYGVQGLRLVEIGREDLADLPLLVETLRDAPYRFMVFCDDLSFEQNDASYKALKSALEGSVFSQSANVLFYATSNRRHLLPEYHSDNATTAVGDAELHHGEAVEEKISLSDRFGLWLSFYPFRQDTYLEVVAHCVAELAHANGLSAEMVEQLTEQWQQESLQFALARGARNGRAARYFAKAWVGRVCLEQRDASPSKN